MDLKEFVIDKLWSRKIPLLSLMKGISPFATIILCSERLKMEIKRKNKINLRFVAIEKAVFNFSVIISCSWVKCRSNSMIVTKKSLRPF